MESLFSLLILASLTTFVICKVHPGYYIQFVHFHCCKLIYEYTSFFSTVDECLSCFQLLGNARQIVYFSTVYIPRRGIAELKIMHTYFIFEKRTQLFLIIVHILPELYMNEVSHIWLLRDFIFCEPL